MKETETQTLVGGDEVRHINELESSPQTVQRRRSSGANPSQLSIVVDSSSGGHHRLICWIVALGSAIALVELAWSYIASLPDTRFRSPATAIPVNAIKRKDKLEKGSSNTTFNTGRSMSKSGLPDNFVDHLRANNFNIEEFADENGYPKYSSQVTQMLYLLADYISKPPPAQIKVDERPIPLAAPNCNDGYFKGKRDKPAYIVDVILFGYELDLLEIRLYELDEVVDQFVIWESGFNQRGDRKPLLFSRNWSRFARFSQKIVHIVQDDSDIPKMHNPRKEKLKPGDNWSNEARMRHHAVEGWVKYLGGESNIPSNHLLITGDLDEMPSGAAIQAFKYCNNAGLTAAFYTTMWRMDLEHLTPMKDWSGYWSQPMITKFGKGYRHSRDHMVPFRLYPGAHMNRCLPPAAIAFKALCLAEDGKVAPNGDIMALYLSRRCRWLGGRKSIDPKDWKKPQYVPWFAKANPDRFPYLYPSKYPEYSSLLKSSHKC